MKWSNDFSTCTESANLVDSWKLWQKVWILQWDSVRSSCGGGKNIESERQGNFDFEYRSSSERRREFCWEKVSSTPFPHIRLLLHRQPGPSVPSQSKWAGESTQRKTSELSSSSPFMQSWFSNCGQIQFEEEGAPAKKTRSCWWPRFYSVHAWLALTTSYPLQSNHHHIFLFSFVTESFVKLLTSLIPSTLCNLK